MRLKLLIGLNFRYVSASKDVIGDPMGHEAVIGDPTGHEAVSSSEFR